MLAMKDIENIESNDCTRLEYYQSIQRAINTGMWALQGSYGRTMMEAIQNGRCMLGKNSARDYWGNYIPSRSEVQEGTVGSRGRVEGAMGIEWADAMDGVQ